MRIQYTVFSIIYNIMHISIDVSKSREKSYGKNTHTQDSTPQQQKPSFVCDRGASLCNPGLLAGEFNVSIQK